MMKQWHTVSPILIILTISLLSCTKQIIDKHEPNTPVNERQEIFLKEGFISNDVFRIVIIDVQDDKHETIESITNKARKRALATLQKYMVDNSMVYTKNTRAQLINLIRDRGRFSKQDISGNTNDVYYLEIKKNNIKGYIDSLASKR